MSQENVELNQRVIDAFNRRDLGAYLELTDPDVEFIPYEVNVQGGNPYRGHFGVRTWWEESFAVFPDLRGEVHEIRDLGDRTLARGRIPSGREQEAVRR
jgi:ketosteroid isomerase-like protein